jgi:hypothetical protein
MPPINQNVLIVRSNNLQRTTLARRRNTKARTDGTGDKPTVSQVALIRLLAGFCCGLAVLTIFWPDWIEALTGTIRTSMMERSSGSS